jgi:hypothetical protein
VAERGFATLQACLAAGDGRIVLVYFSGDALSGKVWQPDPQGAREIAGRPHRKFGKGFY